MWKEIDQHLCREFTFRDFAEAFSFMTEVAFLAEKQNHHPEWTNVWNVVSFRLSTHDAGNIITEKDRRLAANIDTIYRKFENQPDDS